MQIQETLYQVDILYKSSKQTDEYYEIPFTNEKGDIHVTYVDPGYRNYKKWKKIIDNPDDRVVITNAKIKTTRGGKLQKNRHKEYIIDADSKFKTIDTVSDKVMNDFFKEMNLT